MKNPIKQFIKWILTIKRRFQFNKRQKAYVDVIDILGPLNAQKREKQNALIKKIIENSLKDTGINYESKFIPTSSKNELHIRQIIINKYGKEMEALNVTLTKSLKLECI